MRCIAITKSGTQCRNSALPDREFCAIHHNSTGDIVPFAESLPSDLVTDFTNSIGWKRILSNRDNLAYLESLKAAKMRKEGGGRDFFNELNEAWKSYKLFEKSGDTQSMAMTVREMGDLIEKGHRKERLEREILDIIERERRLRLDEINAETKIGLLVPVAEVIQDMRQYVGLVMAAAVRIMSPQEFARLASELQVLIDNPPVIDKIAKGGAILDLSLPRQKDSEYN